MRFYVGLDDLHHALHFERVFVSVNRLRRRKRAPFVVHEWIIDSGAFTEISHHGCYRHPVSDYAAEVRRWAHLGTLVAVVAQDLMCEPFILRKTGRTVASHQAETVARYDALLAEELPAYVMPVIQGFLPIDYARHVVAYGDRLLEGAWVGVGSVCKRNAAPGSVAAVLSAIKAVRPDLRLHGFGVKLTALAEPGVLGRLATADSMAWSYHARRNGRSAHDWREARRFEERVAELGLGSRDYQMELAV